jgi:hypothetical protein
MSSTTAPPKMSFRSPATMWPAPVTLTYSALGHSSRKLWAPASEMMSERPPRTSGVGSDSRRAHSSKRELRGEASIFAAHPPALRRTASLLDEHQTGCRRFPTGKTFDTWDDRPDVQVRDLFAARAAVGLGP